MSGSAVPVASAGSKKAGVSETCTPHFIVPSAAKTAGAVAASPAPKMRASASRCRDLIRIQPPLWDPGHQAVEKGPDARRRAPRHPEAYSLYVEGCRKLANEADEPLSAAWRRAADDLEHPAVPGWIDAR